MKLSLHLHESAKTKLATYEDDDDDEESRRAEERNKSTIADYHPTHQWTKFIDVEETNEEDKSASTLYGKAHENECWKRQENSS